MREMVKCDGLSIIMCLETVSASDPQSRHSRPDATVARVAEWGHWWPVSTSVDSAPILPLHLALSTLPLFSLAASCALARAILRVLLLYVDAFPSNKKLAESSTIKN